MDERELLTNLNPECLAGCERLQQMLELRPTITSVCDDLREILTRLDLTEADVAAQHAQGVENIIKMALDNGHITEELATDLRQQLEAADTATLPLLAEQLSKQLFADIDLSQTLQLIEMSESDDLEQKLSAQIIINIRDEFEAERKKTEERHRQMGFDTDIASILVDMSITKQSTQDSLERTLQDEALNRGDLEKCIGCPGPQATDGAGRLACGASIDYIWENPADTPVETPVGLAPKPQKRAKFSIFRKTRLQD